MLQLDIQVQSYGLLKFGHFSTFAQYSHMNSQTTE